MKMPCCVIREVESDMVLAVSVRPEAVTVATSTPVLGPVLRTDVRPKLSDTGSVV